MKEYEEVRLEFLYWNEGYVFCGGSMEDLQIGGVVGDDDDIFGE